MSDIYMRILLSAQDSASKIMGNVANAAKAISPGMGIAAGAALAVGAAIVGIGVASVQMASQYQQQMNMVQALTGASSDQMAQYDSQLKQLAVNAGVAPTELAKGLYYVLSASYQGADAMKVLTLSTEDAKIGMTDQTTTANALTTVLKSFSVQSKDFTRVNGEMLETVTLGKMTMTDYAGSIGKASSSAMQYGVSMEDMNASIATMTSNGIPSAHQAVTDFTQAVSVMYANINTVSKSLNKQGIEFNTTKFNALDYTGKVKMLNEALQTAAERHLKVTGVTKQAAAAIQILSQHSQEFSNDLSTLSDKQKMANVTQNAWAITQSGFAQSMSRLDAILQVIMIDIGQQLLPILTNIVNWFANAAQGVIDWATNSEGLHIALQILSDAFSTLGRWIGNITVFFQHNAAAMTALKIAGIALAGAGIALVVAGFIALGIAAWSAAAGVIAATWPILAVGAAIALVIAGLIWLSNTFPPVKQAFQDFGDFVGSIFDVIAQKSQESTLQTQENTLNNTITQKQQLVKQYEQQKQEITDQMGQTHNAVVLAALQTRLDSVDQAEKQATDAIAAAKKQKEGVQQQIEQIDPIVHLHALQTKLDAISQAEQQQKGVIANYEAQKQDITDLMGQTHDIVKQKALETKLDAIKQAEDQHKGVEKSLEKQKASLEKQVGHQKTIVNKQAGGNIFVSAWEGVQHAMAAVGSFIASVFLPIWKQLQDLWKSQVMPLIALLVHDFQKIVPVLQFIGTVLKYAALGAFELFAGILGAIVIAIGGLISALVGIIGGIIQIIRGALQIIGGVVSFFIDLFTGKWSKLGNDLKKIGTGFVTIFQGIWAAIAAVFNAAWRTIVNIVMFLVNGVKQFFVNLWDDLVGHSIIPDMINAILQWFGSLPGKIFAFIDGLVQGAINKFNDFKTGAVRVFTDLVTGIQNAFSGIKNFFVSIGTDMWNGIKGGINLIIGGINGFIGAIDGMQIHIPAVGVGPFKTPAFDWNGLGISKIPMLARGGNITSGGLVIVGDPYAPEAINLPTGASVTPLGRNGGANLGTGTTNIFNISVNGAIGNKQELVNWLEKELNQRFRSSGRLSPISTGGKAV